MSEILLKNIQKIYTMNSKDDIWENYDIYIKNEKIEKIGESLEEKINLKECEIIDCHNKIALPGFVNTHHHLYQALFRGIPEVQEMPLFPWLSHLYEYWKFIEEEAVYYGAIVGLSELVRTGCTCTADHHYVFPKGVTNQLIDAEIRAAQEIGIRFHPTRGSMTLGKDQGGLPPMEVVQSEEAVLLDSERLIQKYHNEKPYSMVRIGLSPCSPFSVTTSVMEETAFLARKHHVMLHTHLAETLDEERFCLEKYHMRPFELMESIGWVGKDVWFAHGIYLNDEEISRLHESGIAHCPSSNMKLGSGICRTSELYRAGAKVSLAVDGSASNDGSNMMEEVRRMYLLNHLKYGSDGLTAYECLKIATRGGAEVLGRTDTGYLAENMAADINLFDLQDIAYAGCHDALISLVSLGNHSFTNRTIINGEIVSIEGKLVHIDMDEMYRKAHRFAQEMVQKRYFS